MIRIEPRLNFFFGLHPGLEDNQSESELSFFCNQKDLF
jgi:hypothetical protein